MINDVAPSKRIRYYSLLDDSGYGQSAFSYMEALEDRGFEIIWSPMVWTKYGLAPWQMLSKAAQSPLDQTSERQSRFMQSIDSDKQYDTVIIHTMPEVYPKLVENGKYNIGYSVWETDTLPKHWPACIHAIDHLMVPCVFNVDLFSLENGPKVSVVPHLAEFKHRLNKKNKQNNFRAHYNINDSDYVFYTINSWSPRKAIDETLLCYLKAFTEEDNVCLVIKTDETYMDFKGETIHTNKTSRSRIDEMLALFDKPPRVVLIDRFISQEEILDLHLSCDCFYSLTHSEGWGLGAYAAATLGNPVIITGWGGQMDFLPKQFSYLVNYKLANVIVRLNWESYTADQNWAYAEHESAVKNLQHVFNNQAEAAKNGGRLAEYIANEFSDEKIINQLVTVIESRNE